MARSQVYKAVFALGWLANFVLFCLVAFVLVQIFLNKGPEDNGYWGITLAFAIFVFLFFGFTISVVVFSIRKTYHTLIAVIVFIVGQLLCVLVTSLSLIATDKEKFLPGGGQTFKQDPIGWISVRRWLPILFAIVFLPLFLIQIFVINRYASRLGLASQNDTGRKSTPYHAEEKIYIAKDGP
ncbi:hypothetical protein Ddc_04199 [Ditylenchus destructor]|nr:hypothetical protein Ddc_04199 [Ditylenchus destructor]